MGCRRENTGRGLTSLRAALPVSEGQHKTEKTWVIDNFSIELIATSRVCWADRQRSDSRAVEISYLCAYGMGKGWAITLGEPKDGHAIGRCWAELPVDMDKMSMHNASTCRCTGHYI